MHKNRLNRKKLRIAFPMVLSMILLVTFVGYWLHSQYYNEKENLQNELSQLYHETRSDTKFILFYQKTIKPALAYTDTSNINELKIGSEKTSPSKKLAYIKDLKALVDSNNSYKKIFSTLEKDLILPDSLRDNRGHELYQLGYKHQIYRNINLNPKRTNSADTSYQFFQNLFIRNLNNRFSNIEIKKEEDIEAIEFKNIEQLNNQIFVRGKLGIITAMYRNKTRHIMLFDNYSFYLITLILPQIFFVFVLISLSVFALVFAYRSYLTQAKLNMLRSDFVSNITHELKIPVATAKLAMEAILDFGITDDKEKTKSYLKMVAMEMNRLDSLTTRVLEHSQLENHQNPLHKQVTNMNSFIERIVESVQLIYTDKIKIAYKIPSDTIDIPIDQVYIEGVIRNLIENSKKYGGNEVCITVNLWQKSSHVYISVVDNGPGIPKEYLKKVFDRFFRVPTGDKHNIKGFGLGLSFASLVMKQHNGTITANNSSEKGCEITLKFLS